MPIYYPVLPGGAPITSPQFIGPISVDTGLPAGAGLALEVAGNVKAFNFELGGSGAGMAFNQYYSSGWKYRLTDYAYLIDVDGVDLGFYGAVSGTAGTNVTNTLAFMRRFNSWCASSH